MKIGILSFRPIRKKLSYEESRLRKAAEALGHKARVFRAAHCQLMYDSQGERIYYKGKRFPAIDVLIPRASVLSDVEIRVSLIKQFQLMDVPVVNTYRAISRAKNKLRTQQILHSHDIPTPTTVVVDGYESLNFAIDRVGGAPVILKDPFGSYGSGVIIAESKRAARSVLDAIWASTGPKILMVQEYIAESGGKDTRVFVVDGKVVAGMQRSAQAEEFRSNMELGGEATAVEVSKEYAKLAIASTKLLKLDVAGVDIIQTKNGPAILEVNSNPGFRSLERVTEVDVAARIIEFAVRKAKKD